VVSKVNIENNQAVLTVEALEIFRGENLKEIIETLVQTSCDMNILVGAYYLVFAKKYNDKVIISPCSYNQRFSSFSYPTKNSIHFGNLEYLRFEYKKMVDGNTKSYFLNGKLAYELTIKNSCIDKEMKWWHPEGWLYLKAMYNDGELHGEVIYYHDSIQESKREFYQFDLLEGIAESKDKNGKLLSQTNYKKGLQNGYQRRWDTNGNLLRESYEKDGISIDTSKWWFDYTPTNSAIATYRLLYDFKPDSTIKWLKQHRLEILTIHDKDGYILERKEYYLNGNIQADTKYEPIQNLLIKNNYEVDGTKKSTSISIRNKKNDAWGTEIYSEYMEDGEGKVSKRIFCDENGRAKKIIRIQNGVESIILDKDKGINLKN
jgi:antitoxin component YwqK of YwqJK toxin-antitoxin module